MNGEQKIEAPRRFVSGSHLGKSTFRELDRAIRIIRDLLAVFEEANTPTDDATPRGMERVPGAVDPEIRPAGFRPEPPPRGRHHDDPHDDASTDDERDVIEKIKLAGHLAAEAMVFQGDTYPVKAIPYTSFLHILDSFHRTVQGEPSSSDEYAAALGDLEAFLGDTAEGSRLLPALRIVQGVVQGEPSESVADSDTAFELGRVAGYDEAMREVQGEPSDATAEEREAVRRIQSWLDSNPHLGDKFKSDLRLTLRAAAAAEGGER